MGFEEFAVINSFYGIKCITDLVLCSSAVITDPCKCVGQCQCCPITVCGAGPRCEFARSSDARSRAMSVGVTVRALDKSREGQVGVIRKRLEGQRFAVFWTKHGAKTEETLDSIEAVQLNVFGTVVDGALLGPAGKCGFVVWVLVWSWRILGGGLSAKQVMFEHMACDIAAVVVIRDSANRRALASQARSVTAVPRPCASSRSATVSTTRATSVRSGPRRRQDKPGRACTRGTRSPTEELPNYFRFTNRRD